LFIFFAAGIVHAEATNGPLRVCRDNPRYFGDKDGQALLLVGSCILILSFWLAIEAAIYVLLKKDGVRS